MVRGKPGVLVLAAVAFVLGGLLHYRFMCGQSDSSAIQVKLLRQELSPLLHQLPQGARGEFGNTGQQGKDLQQRQQTSIRKSGVVADSPRGQKTTVRNTDADLRPLGWTRVRPVNLTRDNCSLAKGEEHPKNPWEWRCLIEKYFDTVDYKCRDRRWVGNWQLCHDVRWRPRSRSCLVLSFGINNDFRFDDAMADLYNCTVHSFDPSMEVSDYRRSDHVSFHQLGLGSEDNLQYKPRKNYYIKSTRLWRIQTLESVLKLLGKDEAVVDVLKMDVELTEWPVLIWLLTRPVLLGRVRQLMVEWHLFRDAPRPQQYQQLHEALQTLRGTGFFAFRSSFPGRRPRSSQAEISYVNVRA